MSKQRLVVVGSDAAGMSAASQARRMRTSDSLDIVAFEMSPHTSYAACGIPLMAAGLALEQDLIARNPEQFGRDHQIDARVLHEVTDIDLASRRVKAYDHTRSMEVTEGFDHLMISTGARAVKPELEGIDSSNVFLLRDLESGLRLRKLLDESGPQAAVIIGAGDIGLEMAEALAERRIPTTIVEGMPVPMATVIDEELGELVADALVDRGVTIHMGEFVTKLVTDGDMVTAVVTDDREIVCDMVIVGVGTAPRVELASAAGIRLGVTGAIEVDDHLRTGTEGVWSAGDCAQQIHRVSGQPVNVHLGTVANKMGRIAGTNIGGGDKAFPGVLGTAITKVFDTEIARTGLSLEMAEAAGLEAVAVRSGSRTKAHYFPSSMRMHTVVTVERQTGRLLGAQIVGGPGAAKRIDVYATALWNEMTVEEMEYMDLSYAPFAAPVWDPVLIAARKAQAQI